MPNSNYLAFLYHHIVTALATHLLKGKFPCLFYVNYSRERSSGFVCALESSRQCVVPETGKFIVFSNSDSFLFFRGAQIYFWMDFIWSWNFCYFIGSYSVSKLDYPPDIGYFLGAAFKICWHVISYELEQFSCPLHPWKFLLKLNRSVKVRLIC